MIVIGIFYQIRNGVVSLVRHVDVKKQKQGTSNKSNEKDEKRGNYKDIVQLSGKYGNMQLIDSCCVDSSGQTLYHICVAFNGNEIFTVLMEQCDSNCAKFKDNFEQVLCCSFFFSSKVTDKSCKDNDSVFVLFCFVVAQISHQKRWHCLKDDGKCMKK